MNTLSVDHRDPLFPQGPGLGLRAFALLAVCGFLIFCDFRTPKTLEPFRQSLSWALSPLLWMAVLPQHIADARSYLTSRDQLSVENQALRDHQLQLEARLQKFEALEAENNRIRELLASAKTLQENVLITEIVQSNQDPYHQITLNKGARDRVYRGQALVDATGVMGRIVQVNPTTSIALLITDPEQGIPVEINRTGLQTVALGVGDGQTLRLPFLTGNADIQKGDLLVSSALGGQFPAGYPVGQVFEINHHPGEHFAEALAYPTAKLNQGRQALLVWNPNHADTAETLVSLPEAQPDKAPPAKEIKKAAPPAAIGKSRKP